MIKTITEACKGCKHELEIEWSVGRDGFKLFCPYHDSPQMPCCESQDSPEEALKRVAASAKQAAETCASACENLSALALAFAKPGEALERKKAEN